MHAQHWWHRLPCPAFLLVLLPLLLRSCFKCSTCHNAPTCPRHWPAAVAFKHLQRLPPIGPLPSRLTSPSTAACFFMRPLFCFHVGLDPISTSTRLHTTATPPRLGLARGKTSPTLGLSVSLVCVGPQVEPELWRPKHHEHIQGLDKKERESPHHHSLALALALGCPSIHPPRPVTAPANPVNAAPRLNTHDPLTLILPRVPKASHYAIACSSKSLVR